MDVHPMPTDRPTTPTATGIEERPRRTRRLGMVAAIGLVVLALGACGGRTSGAATAPTTVASGAANASIDRAVDQELHDVDAVLADLDRALAED